MGVNYNPKTHNPNLAELKEVVAKLPKVELHRHLPGSLRFSTILDLTEEYKLDLPTKDPEEIRRLAEVNHDTPTDLYHILGTVSRFLEIFFVSREALARITYEALEDAWNDGLIYVELRFSPGTMGGWHDLPMPDVIGGIREGIQKACNQYPIRTGIILGMFRTQSLEILSQTADIALDPAAKGEVVGIDYISGDDPQPPGAEFMQFYEPLRKNAHLSITTHAGEGGGPERVRRAIDLMGAQRIGHGVRAAQDPMVVDYIREKQIHLETCPSSNVATGAVPNIAAHPLPQYLRAGIQASISTDDPGWFDITLTDEYCLALTGMGLSFQELRQSVLHAISGTFLPLQEQKKLEASIIQAYDRAAPDINIILEKMST